MFRILLSSVLQTTSAAVYQFGFQNNLNYTEEENSQTRISNKLKLNSVFLIIAIVVVFLFAYLSFRHKFK